MSEVKETNRVQYSCQNGAPVRMTLESFASQMAKWEKVLEEQLAPKRKPAESYSVPVEFVRGTEQKRKGWENSTKFDPNDYEYLQDMYE